MLGPPQWIQHSVLATVLCSHGRHNQRFSDCHIELHMCHGSQVQFLHLTFIHDIQIYKALIYHEKE